MITVFGLYFQSTQPLFGKMRDVMFGGTWASKNGRHQTDQKLLLTGYMSRHEKAKEATQSCIFYFFLFWNLKVFEININNKKLTACQKLDNKTCNSRVFSSSPPQFFSHVFSYNDVGTFQDTNKYSHKRSNRLSLIFHESSCDN